jgi:hypothetical protein
MLFYFGLTKLGLGCSRQSSRMKNGSPLSTRRNQKFTLAQRVIEDFTSQFNLLLPQIHLEFVCQSFQDGFICFSSVMLNICPSVSRTRFRGIDHPHTILSPTDLFLFFSISIIQDSVTRQEQAPWCICYTSNRTSSASVNLQIYSRTRIAEACCGSGEEKS